MAYVAWLTERDRAGRYNKTDQKRDSWIGVETFWGVDFHHDYGGNDHPNVYAMVKVSRIWKLGSRLTIYGVTHKME